MIKARSTTTFSWYIPMYTSVHLDISLWGGIHGLCILWNSFDLRCESVKRHTALRRATQENRAHTKWSKYIDRNNKFAIFMHVQLHDMEPNLQWRCPPLRGSHIWNMKKNFLLRYEQANFRKKSLFFFFLKASRGLGGGLRLFCSHTFQTLL